MRRGYIRECVVIRACVDHGVSLHFPIVLGPSLCNAQGMFNEDSVDASQQAVSSEGSPPCSGFWQWVTSEWLEPLRLGVRVGFSDSTDTGSSPR
jgi:hypothetical protein